MGLNGRRLSRCVGFGSYRLFPFSAGPLGCATFVCGAFIDMCIVLCIGTGTFGRVRLARHKGSKKYMALKILKKSEVCGRGLRRYRVSA